MRARSALIAALLGTLITLPASGQDVELLSGHGGPIKGIAVSPDGISALTASFDYSVGYWALEDTENPVWLEDHRAAVNAVIFVDNLRAASAGDDFDILIWDLKTGASLTQFSGHQGKIISLNVSPDGKWLASASWDGSIGLWSLDDLTLHKLIPTGSNVNDVVFDPDSSTLYSAGFDGTIRKWDVASGTEQRIVVRHGFGINKLIISAKNGWLAYGALDGGTRAIRLSDGKQIADLTLERRPILSLALSPDETRLIVGDGEGYVMSIDTTTWKIIRDFKAALRGPIWALQFSADGTRIFAGGIDDAAFIWPVDQDSETKLAISERSFLTKPEDMGNGERQFQRKCSICHTLTPGSSRKAGPSLHGIFGRKAGSLPKYKYSQTLHTSEIIWSNETIDRLFDLGPDVYTPGTKMPMQRITDPKNRTDLLEFLKQHTSR